MTNRLLFGFDIEFLADTEVPCAVLSSTSSVPTCARIHQCSREGSKLPARRLRFPGRKSVFMNRAGSFAAFPAGERDPSRLPDHLTTGTNFPLLIFDVFMLLLRIFSTVWYIIYCFHCAEGFQLILDKSQAAEISALFITQLNGPYENTSF